MFIPAINQLCLLSDDASVVLARLSLWRQSVRRKSLEERIDAIEAQLAGKTLQEHFREQAELIDRLFVYRFDEFERKWEAKLESRLESKLEPIRQDLASVKQDLDSVKQDLETVKHDVKAILERLR
jgi:uncharacterized membrane-anchored protein YhcB (DUF1043 family)